MDIFVVMTLAKATDYGMKQLTMYQTVTASPQSTRAALFDWMLKKAPEEMQGGNVLFYSAEPNALVAPAAVEAVSGS
ncbi:hypothetical protein [Streptosporangium sp. V21-05]|uniref:hypothetical protein n=1 Tax=Streptosporangium sp. V21-05 TaxID=3446115 RepID=UPI003F529163